MTVHLGDCRKVLADMEPESFDSCVTDPPAGIAFMNKGWDHARGGRDRWCSWMQECAEAVYRVLKPGAHALVWALPRTAHWTATAWEDAGFEVREKRYHVFGSGFPKSLNVSAAIERLEISAIERRFCAWVKSESGLTPKNFGTDRFHECRAEVVNTATKEAPRWGRRALVPTFAAWEKIRTSVAGTVPDWVEDCIKNPPQPPIEHPGQWKRGRGEGTAGTGQWQGWGTATKPAVEEWILLRKPLSEPNVAANVLRHGTGAINVDGCRVATDGPTARPPLSTNKHEGYRRPWNDDDEARAAMEARREEAHNKRDDLGRWPPNLSHDGSPEALAAFARFGESKSTASAGRNGKDQAGATWGLQRKDDNERGHTDTGTAARFFPALGYGPDDLAFYYSGKAGRADRAGSSHPTVKPIALMRWLCRLVTPPGGRVLDPFAGSGATMFAALREGFKPTGIEITPEHHADILKRLAMMRGEDAGLFAEPAPRPTQEAML
jgi:hypothetical protein